MTRHNKNFVAPVGRANLKPTEKKDEKTMRCRTSVAG
jgi:hypothetical protein